MKHLITLLICLTAWYSQAQVEKPITLGTGRLPLCGVGSGFACSSQSDDSTGKNAAAHNAALVCYNDGRVVLRYYRAHISAQDEVNILGKPITPQMSSHQTTMLAQDQEVPKALQKLIKEQSGKEMLRFRESVTYPTTITPQYIDITIAGPTIKN